MFLKGFEDCGARHEDALFARDSEVLPLRCVQSQHAKERSQVREGLSPLLFERPDF